MSAAKVRKLLITAGVRDNTTYYENTTADTVLKLWQQKKSVDEISAEIGLSKSSITGYLPHSKTLYRLDSLSAEAERIKLYRDRKVACENLKAHIYLPDMSFHLWKAVIAFQHYPFVTLGRGKDHSGSIKFTYEVSSGGGSGGRHYEGETVPGFGNEMWIVIDGVKREKSISRSTVELALKNALEEQERTGFVSGPRKLGVPGCRSQLYSLFLRFGVITKE